MSERKIGALIVIEQSQTLEEYISTGIKLDADITSELLINIFIPNTPCMMVQLSFKAIKLR
jgi:diadenylate cyclase